VPTSANEPPYAGIITRLASLDQCAHNPRMTDWRDRSMTVPTWLHGLFSGGTFALLLFIASLITGNDLVVSAITIVIAAVFFGAIMAANASKARREQENVIGPRSEPELIALNRAVRLGRLPDDPALDEPLLGIIGLRRRAMSGMNRLGPWIWTVLAVLLIVSAIDDPDPVTIGTAVVIVAAAIYSPTSAGRRAAKLDHLEAEVRARHPEKRLETD